MSRPGDVSIPISPNTRLVISERIEYDVVETNEAAESWQIIGPESMIITVRWLQPNTLKVTMPKGHSCRITLLVHPGAEPRITRCK